MAELVSGTGDADKAGAVAPAQESPEAPGQVLVVPSSCAQQERQVPPAGESAREPERDPGREPDHEPGCEPVRKPGHEPGLADGREEGRERAREAASFGEWP